MESIHLSVVILKFKSCLKMKTSLYFQRIVITAILFLSVGLYAQRYPVQVTHTVFPPYSSKLSDYVTSNDVKFRLNIALTDILGSNEQVKLKLRIQGNGFNIQSTDVVVGAPQIFLTGGVLQQFTNLELSAYFQPNNLIGIPPQQYNRPLPEGMYTICWDVYDVVTNQQINNPSSGCANIFLLLNDPPFLNLPYKGDYILAKDPMNVIFQWTPRHTNATNVSYDFELRELWDITMDPRAAFLAAPNYYTETLNNTTLLYDISKPVLLPKRTYGWRVKAKSVTGISENSVFKNNGYSEIFYFTYANPCEVPTYILSEALNSSTVKISWEPHFDHKEFHVQYKRADVPGGRWFEVYTYNNFAQIGNLEEGKTYEFRVGGTCKEPYELYKTFSYSNVSQFTMPNKEDVATYNCGIIPDIEIKGRNPLKSIGVNETFTAGDFSVTVKQVYGGNGVFTGRGYITVPYLQDTKIAVTFSSIHLNDHHQLIYGVVKTTYDPTWSGVEDVNDLVLGGAGNSGATTVDFVVEDVQIDPNGDIIIIGANGEIVELPGGEDYVITDANGQTWSVDEEGNVTESGEVAEGGATNSENTNGVNNQGEAIALTAEGVVVTFTNDSNDVYGFDAYQKDQKETKNLYKTLNNDYVIPYKAVPRGKETTIIANLDITDKNIQPQDIVFKTKDGIAISKIDSTATSYTLKLKGAFTDASIETQAVVKKSGKYEVAGAFIQYQAEVKNIDVVLVNATNNNIEKVKESLQSIYKKALVEVNIKEIKDFTSTLETLVPGLVIESDESELFAKYTSDQKEINKALKARDDFNKNAYYLILTNKEPSTRKEKGIMPLGKQFGYVYVNNGATDRTVAHELGHGAFQLKHPFSSQGYGYSEKATNWLLDYGRDVKLPFVHWRSIHNPTLRIGIFDADSEGQSVATAMPISLAINKKKYNGKYYFGYLTPSGERLVLSDDYTPIFFHGIANDTYNEVIPGTLIGFKRKNSNNNRNVSEQKIDEVVYKAKIENGQFLGYENFYYQAPDLNGDVATSFVIGLPFGESKSNKAQWKNYKFDSKNILEYQNETNEIVTITSETFQNIGLFNTVNPEITEVFTEISEIFGDGQIAVSELEIQLLSGEFNPVYVNEKKNTQGRVRNTKVHISHNERREVFLIVKIAEIYNRYPVLFKEFTNFFNNWDQSFLIKTFSDYGKWDDENIPFGGTPSQAYDTWKENLKLESSNDALYNFYQDFLIELLAFTNEKATENNLCLSADFKTKSSQEVYECIAKASENELINLSVSKQIEGIKKILLLSTNGGSISDKEEIQVARILEAIASGPSSNYQKVLALLETEEITYNVTNVGQYAATSNAKTYPLWYALFKNIQDEVFVFGEDNKQSIVASIGKIFIGSESFQEQLKRSIDIELLKEMTFEDIKTIHNQFFTYENDYQNIFRRGWSHIKTDFRRKIPGISIYDEDDFYKSVDTEITDDYLINAEQKIKWGFVKSKTLMNENLSPFQLISFINISKNNLLKPFTAKDQNGNPQAIFIPAFTLHYASETDALQTKSDIIQTSVDLLAFLPTGGTAALNSFGRFLYYVDKMSSATSMAGTAFRETDPELATYMNHLSLVTGVVSLASFSELVKDGITQKKIGEVIDPEVLKETNNQVANVNQLVTDILQDDVHLKKLTPAQLQASTKILEEEIIVLKTNTDFDIDRAQKAVEKLKSLDVSNNSVYKNIEIVGSPYPDSYRDIEISTLTTLHPVPRKSQPNGVNSVIEKIKAEGFHIRGNDGAHSSPVRVVELPDGTKVVIDGMHRVAAMQKLGETHIPVSYYTYDEVFKAFEAGMNRNSIDNIFITLHIGKRTGYYLGDWMPNIPWESNGRNEALSEVDDFMKKEFPDLAGSSEGKLASLKGLIFNEKLRTVFQKELSGEIKRINEFNSNPNLVDAWVDMQRTLDANSDAFPKNIDFTGFNFDTGDTYIDIIIHFENGKFISRVEGVDEVVTIEKLAKAIDATSSEFKVRLLSCSTEEAAIALSKLTEKPFYANDGKVKLYPDGEVVHVTPFQKYHRGARSGVDEIPPNFEPRPGTPIVLGKETGIDEQLQKIFKENAEEVQGKINELNFSDETLAAFVDDFASLRKETVEVVGSNPLLVASWKVYDDVFGGKPFQINKENLQSVSTILEAIGGYKKWKNTAKGKENKLWDSVVIEDKSFSAVLLNGETVKIGNFNLNEGLRIINFSFDVPNYIQRQGIMGELFQSVLIKHDPIEIKEMWLGFGYADGMSTSLYEYQKNLNETNDKITAAFATPTGKIAKLNGYDGTPVFLTQDENIVELFFTKPFYSSRTDVRKLFEEFTGYENYKKINDFIQKFEQHKLLREFVIDFKGKTNNLKELLENPEIIDTWILKALELKIGNFSALYKAFEGKANVDAIKEKIQTFKLSSNEEVAFVDYIVSLDRLVQDEILVNTNVLEPLKAYHDIVPQKQFDLPMIQLQQIHRILKKIGGYNGWKSSEKGKKNQLWNRIEIDDKDHAYVILLDNVKTHEIGGLALSKQGTFIHTVDLPQYLREQKIATEIFRRGIEKYNPIEIEETWGATNINHSDVSTNLSVYLSEVKKGKTREQAAFLTPSGKLAKQNGYSGIPVFMIDTEARVDVFFTKPVNKQRTAIKQLFSKVYSLENKENFDNVIQRISQLNTAVVDDFIQTFRGADTRLKEFIENPDLIGAWGKIKNILVENKSAYPSNIDLAGINFNTGDEFLDVIIHHGEKGFEIRVEGKNTIIPIELLADVMNSIPENQKVRLLSCNTDKAALALSKIVEKPFYASDGVVKLYAEGTVVHSTPFKRYHRGARSDIDEIKPSTDSGKGASIHLGKQDELNQVFGEFDAVVKERLEQLNFSKEDVDAFLNYVFLTDEADTAIINNLNIINGWKVFYDINPRGLYTKDIEDFQQISDLVALINKNYSEEVAKNFINNLDNHSYRINEFIENTALIDEWAILYQLKSRFQNLNQGSPEKVTDFITRLERLDVNYIKEFINDFEKVGESDLQRFVENSDLLISWKFLLDKGSNNRKDFDFLEFIQQNTIPIFLEQVEEKIAILKGKYPDMSVEEFTAIYNYTVMAYSELNAALRGRREMTKDLQIFDNVLRKSLERLPEKYKHTTYRGTQVRESRLEAYKKAFENQNKIVEQAYTSASKSIATAKTFIPKMTESNRQKVLFTIESTKGVDIENISADGPTFKTTYNESEILHISNTEYYVTNYVEKIDENGEKLTLITLSDTRSKTVGSKNNQAKSELEKVFEGLDSNVQLNTIIQKVEGFEESTINDFITDFKEGPKQLLETIAKSPLLVDNWKLLNSIKSPNRLDVDFLKFFNIDLMMNSWKEVTKNRVKLKQLYPNVTLDELTAVYHYTSSLYTVEGFNKALRDNVTLKGNLQIFNNVLKKSLEKFPKYKEVTYRGITTEKSKIERYKIAYENKTNVEELGYLSTSKDRFVAGLFSEKIENEVRVIFTIQSNKGVDIENVSLLGPTFSNVSESEVLFLSGEKFKVTEFRITKDDDDRELVYITLED